MRLKDLGKIVAKIRRILKKLIMPNLCIKHHVLG